MNHKNLLYLTGLIFLLGAGCVTFEDVAFKTVGTQVITADGAIRGWLDYKNTHPVPQAQIDEVKNAYDKYYACTLAEKAAAISFKTNADTNSLNRTITMTAIASSEVLRAVMLFLPPDRAMALKGGK